MDLAQKPVYKLDLAAGTSVVNLTTPLVEGDDRAQTFTLDLTDKGAPANLNGYSVTAYFGRGKTAEAEADTIPVPGTVSGNVATITLTESCYSRSCYFSMPIRLSNGATGQKRTYLIVRGTVVKSVDGRIIDPDGSVPSLDDLFAQIAVMERSRQAAEEATEEALVAAARADEAREGIQGDLAALTKDMALNTAPPIVPTATGSIVTITDGAARPAVEVISHIEPVQEGSGVPSPDNMRSISGWNSVTARRTGANLLNYDAWKDKPVNNGTAVWANNGVAITAGANGDAYTEAAHAYIACVPGVKYVLSWAHSGGVGMVYIFPKGSTDGMVSMLSGDGHLEYTPPEGVDFFTFRVGVVNAGSTAVYTDVRVNIGSDRGFTPYQGKTLTATLPETVYGGKLDWETGLLTVTHYKYVADGTAKIFATPHSDFNYRIGITLPKTGVAYNIGNPICDRIAHNADVFFDTSDNVGFCVHDLGLYIRFGENSGLTTTDAIKNYLTANPMTFVYQLAEPYTIQLTPQQLDTLKGHNNVWSDCGDTTLSYVADTKLYIDQKLAAIAAATL